MCDQSIEVFTNRTLRMFLCFFQLPKGWRPESSGQVVEGSGEPDLLRDAELQPDGDPGGDQP